MSEAFWIQFGDPCSDNRKSKIKNPKWWGLFAFAFTFTFGGATVQAQQPTKVNRLGFLSATSASTEKDRIDAFREGMRELGYVEDKNLLIEWRFAERKLDRLPDLAAELMRVKVAIVVTTGATSTSAAKDTITTIPIVMAAVNDPVGNGFIDSLARPGRNITGLSTLALEVSGKRLEFLKEIVPKLSRPAVLGTSGNPDTAQSLREVELAAAGFGMRLQYLDIRDQKDIETSFRAAIKGRADAVLVLPSPVTNSLRTQIVDLAAKSRLPAIYNAGEWVDEGGLMSYGVSVTDLYRRAATYVDKILKGAKPADLPVEQPTKFEFIINLKAAKQIGLIIPPNVLARADRVIK